MTNKRAWNNNIVHDREINDYLRITIRSRKTKQNNKESLLATQEEETNVHYA